MCSSLREPGSLLAGSSSAASWTEGSALDFTFDETQKEIANLASAVLSAATPARIGEVGSGEGLDRDLWAEFARADLLGLALPEEVGGSGHGILELAVLLEEVGRRVAPIPLYATIVLGALPVAAFAGAELRERLLLPVLRGTSLLTAALEESARHDPLIPSTTATPDGSGWRLDGAKVTVPYGGLADHILVTAQTPDESIVVLVVDPSARGVTISPTRSTHHEPQANITFEGVRVQSRDMLAGPEDGGAALRFMHRHAVAGICAMAVGVLDEAVRITAGYISQREQFGRPIATFQGATLKAADAYIDTEAVRATTWSAIWRLAAGLPVDDELAVAKYWVAYGGQNVVHACQHLHGGIGVDIDYPIHRYFLWAKALELWLGGTTQQLLRIGASIAQEA